MNANEAIKLAAQYFPDKHIEFNEPVRAIEIEGSTLEIVFTASGALDPNLVLDPSDVRVLVHTDLGEVTLIPEM